MLVGETPDKVRRAIRPSVAEQYPPGYDHRAITLDQLKEQRNTLMNELSELREERSRYDNESDFEIRSRQVTADTLSEAIDALMVALKETADGPVKAT